MSHSSAESFDKKIRWFAISLALAPLVLYLYLFFEWLFFATKPSMISGLGWVDQIQILIRSPAPFMALVVGAQVIAAAISLALPWRWRIVALLPSAAILGSLLLMLLDNFTYVLFDFGIVQSGPILRWLYLLVLAAALAVAAKVLFDTGELVRRSSGRKRGLIVALLLLPVAAAVASIYLPDMERISYGSELVLRDSRSSSGGDLPTEESPIQQESMDFRPNILFSLGGWPSRRTSLYLWIRPGNDSVSRIHERRMAAF